MSVQILSIKQFHFLKYSTPFSTIFLCLGCSMIRLKCLLILISVPGRVLLVEIAKKFSNHRKQKKRDDQKIEPKLNTASWAELAFTSMSHRATQVYDFNLD